MSTQIKVNLEYPFSPDFEYQTQMVRLNLDEERVKDIVTGNGFIIGPPSGKLKKDLKDPNGIFSERYGRTLKDLNPFSTRYKCQCGYTMFKINKDSVCPICGTKVKYVDDNFEYFGWKVLKEPYFIIHPSLYKTIEAFIGKDRLERMLDYKKAKDMDGHIDENAPKPKEAEGEPFYGIGMLDFKKRFDEIIEYYAKSATTPTKKAYYEDIRKEREKIFSQSIPVFTFLLRPVEVNQQNFCYEDANTDYVMINKLASRLNVHDDLVAQEKEVTSSNEVEWDLQIHVNKLYVKIDKILQKKKGVIRSLLAGRYNFSSRSVITPNPDLRIDQITLPYKCLCEILQQRIINILQKTYNISGSDAYNMWYKASIKPNEIVVNIIKTLINTSCGGKGLPFIINRNPTIAYGGILQMYCVGINFNYVMGIPLQILPLLAAKKLATHAGM